MSEIEKVKEQFSKDNSPAHQVVICLNHIWDPITKEWIPQEK